MSARRAARFPAYFRFIFRLFPGYFPLLSFPVCDSPTHQAVGARRATRFATYFPLIFRIFPAYCPLISHSCLYRFCPPGYDCGARCVLPRLFTAYFPVIFRLFPAYFPFLLVTFLLTRMCVREAPRIFSHTFGLISGCFPLISLSWL